MTNRKRYSITVNERMEKQIEEFKEGHGFATSSGAVEELIRLGLYALKEEQAEEERKGREVI